MSFLRLLEKLRPVNEMKDEVILSVTKVVDDDTGVWAGDEFEFALTSLYEEYTKDPESAKRLADELRRIADMTEQRAREGSEV